MAEPYQSASTYDLGIHGADVRQRLAEHDVVRIVGYERSGKSTLAEILARELAATDMVVVHQDATAWLAEDRRPFDENPQHVGLDAELAQVFARLEATESSCWIIDDADVLVGYASDSALDHLANQLRARRFGLVLIRNRFVQEHSGWFKEREAALHPNMPILRLEPLGRSAAIEVCLEMYTGPHARMQAEWLTDLSGGIPGLLDELAPLAPTSPEQTESEHLARRVAERRQLLSVDQPMRARVLRALRAGILPPPALLSEAAAVEIGVLVRAGMVDPSYALLASPFRGGFWARVGAVDPGDPADPASEEQIALELEILVQRSGLSDLLPAALGLDAEPAGSLAVVFARCLLCERLDPGLVRPLLEILAERLGKVWLLALLQHQAAPADPSSGNDELARQILDSVRPR